VDGAPARHRWPGLDGLRGCAVLAVIAFHLGVAPGGFVGVDVFFVLSGFLITRLLIAEHDRTGTVRLPRFYARRALRLYPALVVLVAFFVMVAVATGRAVAETLHDAVATLLYVTNIVGTRGGLLSHTWTLALEEQFYLVWPALLLLCLWLRRASGSSRLGWLPAVGLVVGVLVLDLLQGRTGVAHTYVRAMGLPLGCALALVRLEHLAWAARLAWPAGIALAVTVFMDLPAELTAGWPISVGAVLAAAVVAALVLSPGGLLATRWPRYFGLRSYSLYLWHLPLISLAVHHAPEPVPHSLAVTLGLAASLLAAEASYRYVEMPVNSWRNRRLASARPAAGPLDSPVNEGSGARGGS
jgi:peptidoglycan/LPS O-acetylase OafA/YrhL